MADTTKRGAVVAALFLLATAVAQETPTVEARLAAAKLAETRGDLAKAEAELRAALEGAPDAERFKILLQQALMRRRLGVAESELLQEAARATPGPSPQEDPVQRLIGTLELGTRELEGVKAAVQQLRSLGSLAVPPLLAALPKVGPFGLANALDVLGTQADARIAPALLARLIDADPAVTLAIAQRLRGMNTTIAVPVARALAVTEAPPEVLLGAFTALRQHGVMDEAVRTLAVRVAQQPAVHAALADALDDATDDVALAVQRELCNSASGAVRAGAMSRWLRAQQDLTEAAALEQLARLEPEFQWWVARDLVGTRREWVRVGLLALRHYQDGREQLNESWFDQTEWWRLPEQAAPALLGLAAHGADVRREAVARVLVEFLKHGWVVPVDLQQPLGQLLLSRPAAHMQEAFVQALSAADEERALATWQRLDGPTRERFTHTTVRAERPWHRLIARQLATYESVAAVRTQLVNRDWSGAPPEAIEALVALVERFPRAPENQNWELHEGVIRAYQRCTNLPAAVVRPLLWRRDAWAALVKREPKTALAYARSTHDFGLQEHLEINTLLRDFGTAEDVPLAVRLFPADDPALGGFNAPANMSGILEFLRRHGRGRMEVIALGCGSAADRVGLRRQVAAEAAAGLRADQVPEVLAMFGEFADDVRERVVHYVTPLVQQQHGPMVRGAIESALAITPGKRRMACLTALAGFAAATKDPECLPVLRRMLENAGSHGLLDYWAAGAMLAVAGSQAATVMKELLGSPSPEVVLAAIRRGDVQATPEIRQLAKEALLRIAFGETDCAGTLERFGAAGALEIAKSIVQSDRFRECNPQTGEEVLSTFRRQMDAASAVAEIARGRIHRSLQVRLHTTLELGNTFTREAAPFLIEMLKDEEPDVRKVAQGCLDQLANYLDARDKWEKRLK